MDRTRHVRTAVSHFAELTHTGTDFVNHSYDYRQNWTPLSPVTIVSIVGRSTICISYLYPLISRLQRFLALREVEIGSTLPFSKGPKNQSAREFLSVR